MGQPSRVVVILMLLQHFFLCILKMVFIPGTLTGFIRYSYQTYDAR